jgi:hypothetical protein
VEDEVEVESEVEVAPLPFVEPEPEALPPETEAPAPPIVSTAPIVPSPDQPTSSTRTTRPGSPRRHASAEALARLKAQLDLVDEPAATGRKGKP